MPIHNSEIARTFREVANLLEIQGANPFRVRAYRNAAQRVESLGKSAADMVEADEDLSSFSGIGQDLAGKIGTIVKTGSLPLLEDLRKEMPRGLNELMRVSGLGPKKVHKLYKELGVSRLHSLKKAAEKGKIRKLQGFGQKTEQNILEELNRLEEQEREKRIRLSEADEVVPPLMEYLQNVSGVKKSVVAGSYRRRKETVGDIDILVTCKKDSPVMDHFVEYEDVRKVVSHGRRRSTVLLRSGLQVDLRVFAETAYGAALHYFTGSKAHNIEVRKIGVRKGYKINEYGVFKGKKRIAGKKEEEVFDAVDLPYIEPELRENRGEIEAARENRLPELITLEDIRGDMHTHTKLTDGRQTLEEMVEAARELGYEYIANSEHSKRVTVAKGLDAKGLKRQIKKIEKLNGKFSGITVLKGIECDILEDGSLDLPQEVLKELDVVVCAVHSKFNLSRRKQTERIIRAMDNPCFNIFAHPTERLIGTRQGMEVDLEQIMQAAKERGCFIELNANPERLDLDDVHCMRAKALGVGVVISTDAHSTDNLKYMRYGVGQARRGWLEARDVLNTQPLKEIQKLLKRT